MCRASQLLCGAENLNGINKIGPPNVSIRHLGKTLYFFNFIASSRGGQWNVSSIVLGRWYKRLKIWMMHERWDVKKQNHSGAYTITFDSWHVLAVEMEPQKIRTLHVKCNNDKRRQFAHLNIISFAPNRVLELVTIIIDVHWNEWNTYGKSQRKYLSICFCQTNLAISANMRSKWTLASRMPHHIPTYIMILVIIYQLANGMRASDHSIQFKMIVLSGRSNMNRTQRINWSIVIVYRVVIPFVLWCCALYAIVHIRLMF